MSAPGKSLDSLHKIRNLAESVLDYASTLEARVENMRRQRDQALGETLLARAELVEVREQRRDLYDEAIREWVARRLRERGHSHYTRDHVRNLRFGPGDPWGGTDVTPGDDYYGAVHCEVFEAPRSIRGHGRWLPHTESIEHLAPAEFIQECLAIYAELVAD